MKFIKRPLLNQSINRSMGVGGICEIRKLIHSPCVGLDSNSQFNYTLSRRSANNSLIIRNNIEVLRAQYCISGCLYRTSAGVLYKLFLFLLTTIVFLLTTFVFLLTVHVKTETLTSVASSRINHQTTFKVQ